MQDAKPEDRNTAAKACALSGLTPELTRAASEVFQITAVTMRVRVERIVSAHSIRWRPGLEHKGLPRAVTVAVRLVNNGGNERNCLRSQRLSVAGIIHAVPRGSLLPPKSANQTKKALWVLTPELSRRA